jgi:small-conductance mechanosensitive channel
MFDVPAPLTPFVIAGITVALTFVFGWLARLVVRGLLRRSSPIVSAFAQQSASVVVWITGGVLALQAVGVSTGVLLVVVGLLGAAAIIALRIPLENVGAKFFADVYTPFKRGDTIRVGAFSGRAIELNPMSTVLLDDENRLVAVPNTTLLREPTVNLSPHAWQELVVPVSVPASVDLATFENRTLKALAKLRPRLDARYPPVFTVKNRTVQGTDLVLTVMVRRPEDRDPVLSEVHVRVSEGLATSRSLGGPEAPRAGGAGART